MREMKDSGIEWIGQIPEEWELTTYRRVFNRRKEYDDNDKQVLSLTIQGVKEKNENYGKMAEDFTGHQIVKKDDLVFTPRDFDATPILSGIAPCDGCISNLYFVLYPHDTTKTYVPYFNYFMWGVKWGGDIWRKLSYGMRFSYNFQQFGALPTVMPPIETQKRIADFLDEKCSKIDRYIEKQQQVIEKLKAYKQSVITEAVTKGLNPDIPMKDSGIEWIGTIPEHWDILKLRAHTRMLTPMRDRPEKLDGDIPWIRIEDYDGKYISASKEGLGVTMETVQAMNLKIYPIGSILCTSSCDLGKCAIVSKEIVSNQRFINIIPDEMTSSEYLYYLMLSNAKRLNHLSTGTIQANLSRVAFEHLLVQFPSLDEQENISRYLDEKCGRIDRIIIQKEKIIADLAEYKKSLIYEAVTGKIEV